MCGGSAEEITKAFGVGFIAGLGAGALVCGLVMINVLAIAEAGAFLAAAAFGASLANVVLLSVLTVYSVASGNEQKLMTYVSLLSTALMGLCVTYGAYGEVTVSGDKGSKTISTEDVSKSSTGKNTYYHVTTREAADKIIESGKLTKSKWETRVFAWSELPSKEQAQMAGIGNKSQVVLKFQTNASFEPDVGITNPYIKDIVKQTSDGQSLPIDITNVERVDFR